jgi:transcriptional regulator with XRE-family HTH domain
MDSRELLKFLGIKIRTLRKEKGISQEKLVELSDLHPTYISNIEQGKVNASICSYYSIANALKIPFSELISLPPPKASKISEVEITKLINSIRELEERKRVILMATVRGLMSCIDRL